LVYCNKEPSESAAGIISVSVIDNDSESTPVPNVEIRISPGDIILKTNADGIAISEVDPGDYFVDADVCCVGPGFIHYHEPIRVIANNTVEVELAACSLCQ
jgi:hypothetical protein